MSAADNAAYAARLAFLLSASPVPIDLHELRQLCFHGIPSAARPVAWKLLLGLLPPDPSRWDAHLAESRANYFCFIRDLIIDPAVPEAGELTEDLNNPLYSAANSAFLAYHRDSAMLEQIIKDVRRTWADSGFLDERVPVSSHCPLTMRARDRPSLPKSKALKIVAPDTSGVPPTPLRRSRTLRGDTSALGLPPPSPSRLNHASPSLPPRRISSVSNANGSISTPRRRSSLTGAVLAAAVSAATASITSAPGIMSPPRPVFAIIDNEDDDDASNSRRNSTSATSTSATSIASPPTSPANPASSHYSSIKDKRSSIAFPSLSVALPNISETDTVAAPHCAVHSRRIRLQPPPAPRRVSSLGLPFTIPTSKHTIATQRRNRFDFYNRVRHLAESYVPEDTASVGWRSDKRCHVLERILFLYAKLNPGVGYVQGMNELLGPVYYVFATDSDPVASANAEADAFFCFTTLMSSARDNFLKSMDGDNSTGIIASMKRLESKLQRRDPELWLDLEVKTVRPMYYAFRWITVLCSQSWPLPDVLRLWDSIFSDPPFGVSGEGYTSTDHFEFMLDFCCGMLINRRHELITGTFSENVQLLQNYPTDRFGDVIREAYTVREEDIREYDDDDRFSIRSGRSGYSTFSVQSVPVFNTLRRVPSRAGSVDIPFLSPQKPRPRSVTFMDMFREVIAGGSDESVAEIGRSISPRIHSAAVPSQHERSVGLGLSSAEEPIGFWQRILS